MSERLVRIMTGLISLVFFMSVTVFGVWLGAGKLSPKYRLHAKFTSAGQGLQTQSDVKIHGINVGQVTSVHLVRGRAQVNMALHSNEKVPVDAAATIRPKTLFGEKFVDIDPGPHEAQGPFLKSNGFIKKTTGGFELEQVLAEAYPILQAVRPEDLTTLLDTLAQGGQGTGPEVNRQISNFQQVSDINVRHDADTRQFLDDLAKLSDELANRAPDLVQAAKDLNVALPVLNAHAPDLSAFLEQASALSSNVADVLEANRPFLTKFVVEGGKTVDLVFDLRDQVPGVVRGLREFFQVLGEAAGSIPDPSSPGTTLAAVKFIVGGGPPCGRGVPCPANLPLGTSSSSPAAAQGAPGAAPMGPAGTPQLLPPVQVPVATAGVQAVSQLVGGLLR